MLSVVEVSAPALDSLGEFERLSSSPATTSVCSLSADGVSASELDPSLGWHAANPNRNKHRSIILRITIIT